MDFHMLIPIARYTNLVILIIAIVSWSWLCIKCKSSGFIAPISWLANVLGFYIFRMIVLANPTQQSIDAINLWSTIIIGHGILLLIITAWIAKERECDKRDNLPKKLELEIKKEMRRYDEWKQ